VLFAAIVVAAWCVAAARALPDVRAALRPRPRGFGTETLLVLLVPLTALLFVLSPNVQDVMSNRYLLPWLSALPVLTGGWLARWWSRGRAGIAAVLVVVIAPLISGLLIHRSSGALDSRWRPQAHEEPLVAVIADLEQRGIRAAYAPYWTAYKATFLAQERVVVTPLASWDRYPPYTAEVDASAHEAYILPVDPPNVSPNGRTLGDAERQRFEAKLAAANRDYDRRDFAFYRVYSARDRSRLLPPPGRQSVIALASPRATLRVLDPPSSLPGQGPSTLAVEVTNTSDAPWSADGISKLAGSLRVTAAYRWLTEDASRSVIVEGERTPLPRDVPVGDTLRLAVRILPPPSPGRYVLRVTLVQENVAWFDQATGSQVALQIDVR